MKRIDYNESPFLTIWEVTRACALKCLHCRAEAQYHKYPLELTTEEGKNLIDQIYEMGSQLLVFTGGDPLMREDIFELMEYAVQKRTTSIHDSKRYTKGDKGGNGKVQKSWTF